MPRPSKRALREARGRSIVENSRTEEIPVEQICPSQIVFTPDLGTKLTDDLRVLYPYMREAPGSDIPLEQILHNFRCDMYPEGEVFWWQLHVLSTLRALDLSKCADAPAARPPVPRVEDLPQEATLQRYHAFDKQQRVRFHQVLFRTAMNPDSFSLHTPDGFCIGEAILDVSRENRERSRRIEKGRARRLASAFGAMCSACKSLGKGKMVCSRCHTVFYCGKDCQKEHWPVHKKDCVKPEKEGASTAKDKCLRDVD